MSEEKATEEMRRLVRQSEEHVEDKVLWIWRTLSSFEEKSATCISDMLLHVSNGAYMDGVMAAKKFITHVDLLFTAADDLDWLLFTKTTRGALYLRNPLQTLTCADNPEACPILEKPSCCARRSSLSSSCSPNHKRLALGDSV